MKRIVFAMAISFLSSAAATDDRAIADQLVAQPAVISDAQFNTWLFRTAGNESRCREQLQASLSSKIAILGQQLRLNESQQQKLRLAAQGDIKQFFDRVERVRDFFRENRTDKQAVNDVLQKIQPLQQELTAGFFGDGSLFQKVLANSLDDAQSEALHVLEEQERVDRHHRAVRQTVFEAEERMPMVSQQRNAFVELLIRRSRPPTKSSSYDVAVVMYYASEIPDEALAEIFDKPQRDALHQFLQRGRQLKPFLQQQGLLVEEDQDE